MTVEVDEVASVHEPSAKGEVDSPPGPSQRPSKLSRLGLGSLVGVGSSEGDAPGVLQPHSDGRSGGGLRNGGERPRSNAIAGGLLPGLAEGHHGSRRGSHCGAGSSMGDWRASNATAGEASRNGKRGRGM